jgi:methylated-DNA-[protein]-cysteine S-methyltransferase
LVLPGLPEKKLAGLLKGDPKSANRQKTNRNIDKKIADYFRGKSVDLRVPVDWEQLTPFQREVLKTVYNIPYGHVQTYKWVGRKIGKPRSARAVGNALARNPIPLVIPCHRVVRGDGTLGGFSAPEGTRLKQWLLDLERGSEKARLSP